MYKFSIKIDDDSHSLTKEDGISFDKFGELLKDLYEAIDPHSGTKCTLGQIRGNCYAADFYTEDEKFHSNFVIVHKNVEQVPLDELEPTQRQYAKTLRKVLGGRYYLQAFDNNTTKVASIKEISNLIKIDYYYSTKTVYGILSELGGVSVTSSKKHIYLDGIGYRINISNDQDLQLKPFYGTHKLMVKIKNKMSAIDGHIISAELISFTVVGESDIISNLKDVGYVDFNLIKDAHTIDDVISRIYDDH